MNYQTRARQRMLDNFLKAIAGVALVALAWALVQPPTLQAQNSAALPTPEVVQPDTPTATMTPAAPSVVGAPRQGLIVGGEPAAVGELPWQVAVHPGPYLCGGTLIASQWVVTAAHCVIDDTGAVMAPGDIEVVAGEYNRSQNDGTEQQRNVTAVYVHPDYDPFGSNDSDIALLQLASPVTLGPSVGVIPLVSSPTHDALVAPGVSSLVSGWGATSEGGSTANILQKVRVPIVSNATCNTAYGGGITANMLCAGLAAGGKDSCQGDSGGPLVVPDGAGWRLAGVVSFGNGCARPNYYGVYTRISSFTTWITSQTGDLPTPAPTSTPAARAYLPMVRKAPTPTPTSPPNVVVNPGFEQGRNAGWQEYSANGWTLLMNSGFPTGVSPHGGQWLTWLGGASNEISYIRQSVTIPANAAILSYWAWIASADYCGYDFGGIMINSNVVNVFDLCQSTSTSGWVRRTVNLSAYAGQTVWLQLRSETDGSLNSNLFIDDVSLTNVAASVNVPVELASPAAAHLTDEKQASVVERSAAAAPLETQLWAPQDSGQK
ncbi:MAG TPA: hypothetical protein DCL15_22815 [Chloroflexi bacterium]|nr:hypothetical protein [Chloroflexota bacterium]HHW85597.1 trypsin-like serine protease [Chloroflexota bacterium]